MRPVRAAKVSQITTALADRATRTEKMQLVNLVRRKEQAQASRSADVAPVFLAKAT